MKVNLKNILGLAALGTTLLTNFVPAWAGYQFRPGVAIESINAGGFAVSGSMVGARYSADTKQNIGCTAFALPTYTWTSCFATNAAGASLVCGSPDPRWAEAVQAMTDSSFIYFEMRNANGGDCSLIKISNDSHLLR